MSKRLHRYVYTMYVLWHMVYGLWYMVVAIHRTRNTMTLLCKHGKYAKIFGFLFAGPLEAMQLECKQYMMDLMCIYYKVSHHIIYRQSYFWCHWLDVADADFDEISKCIFERFLLLEHRVFGNLTRITC